MPNAVFRFPPEGHGRLISRRNLLRPCDFWFTVNENTIVGLKLHVGKNSLRIRLADDMKHAIKLEAYENK